MSNIEIPDGLRQARRELEAVAGYQLLQDWQWLSSVHRWALRFRLSYSVPEASPIPSVTDWVITVSAGYPWGDISVYPAKQNGIAETFPHQSLNDEGPAEHPHRTGGLCLGIMTQAWQIRRGLSEPHTIEGRLLWHVERTKEWVDRASSKTLFRPGDDWEAPARAQMLQQAHIIIGRAGGSLATGSTDRHGMVELLLPNPTVGVLFADRFIGASEDALRAARELGLGIPIGNTEWGTLLNRSSQAIIGVWIKLAQAPVLQHWRLPSTWGELRTWYQDHESASLDLQIAQVISRAGLQTERVGFLLLGYTVPARFGEPPNRLQWESISFDGFSSSTATPVPQDAQPLKWACVYNGRDLMRQVRGQFSAQLCESSVLMIGAGALGSTMAELLVRGGLNQLCIADSEMLQLGNLVRHTLIVLNVGLNKAAAVAARLNASSLDAKVTAHRGQVSSLTLPALMAREPRMVIDTTGSDQVLSDLVEWSRPTLFLSISVGLNARRIYAFASFGTGFPVECFHSQLHPWLARDHEETKELPQPATEGIGCWSPVFPARLDDIYLLASAAVKWIEEVSANPPTQPVLAVFEQDSSPGRFVGVRRVQ